MVFHHGKPTHRALKFWRTMGKVGCADLHVMLSPATPPPQSSHHRY